jgi:hypothetical protein
MGAAVRSTLTLGAGNQPKFSEGNSFARPAIIVY